jgi:ubiquinone/menaquinone biosynthesis C-methylase UbiE
MVSAGRGGRVADVGCGPGRAAAFLATHDLDVVGFDLSTAMVSAARRAHPGITFEEGALDSLPLPDASLAGVVCWYSIIFTPPEHLGAAFAELRRVLEPDGLLLLAFQAGDGEAVHRPNAQGTDLPLTSIRHGLADVARRLEAAGLQCIATAQREPALEHEATPQGFVIARAV